MMNIIFSSENLVIVEKSQNYKQFTIDFFTKNWKNIPLL